MNRFYFYVSLIANIKRVVEFELGGEFVSYFKGRQCFCADFLTKLTIIMIYEIEDLEHLSEEMDNLLQTLRGRIALASNFFFFFSIFHILFSFTLLNH
jgi:hypothetical protein